MKNIYYDPESFGLELVAEIDRSDGYYQFDLFVIWRDESGNLYYAEDSGCSCPSPFETHDRQTITPASVEDICSRLDFLVSDTSAFMYDRAGALADVLDLKTKLREFKK